MIDEEGNFISALMCVLLRGSLKFNCSRFITRKSARCPTRQFLQKDADHSGNLCTYPTSHKNRVTGRCRDLQTTLEGSKAALLRSGYHQDLRWLGNHRNKFWLGERPNSIWYWQIFLTHVRSRECEITWWVFLWRKCIGQCMALLKVAVTSATKTKGLFLRIKKKTGGPSKNWEPRRQSSIWWMERRSIARLKSLRKKSTTPALRVTHWGFSQKSKRERWSSTSSKIQGWICITST